MSLTPDSRGQAAARDGPALSSIALFSRFAREQSLTPPFVAESPAALDAASQLAGRETPIRAQGAETRVNQDFSLRPQNETTIKVNPWSPNMLVAGANDYRLGHPIGAAFYTSFDGGSTWTDGLPPYPLFVVTTGAKVKLVETPFGTGDPVLAFGRARNGSAGLAAGTPVVYYAYLGVSASFCEHGIFVSRSQNGLLWTRPAVPALAPPKGLFTPVFWDRPENCNVFNDKPWLAVDTSGGTHDGRVYVTWSQFRFKHKRFRESPIFMAYSDDNGVNWSTPKEVSGFSNTLCRAQVDGGGNGNDDDDDDDDDDIGSGRASRCDESHFSNISVGPDGRVYIAFVNQQFKGNEDGFRNQYLLTSVDPDTLTVSGPFGVAGMVDGNNDLPLNALDQPTLCNSNFRFNTFGNVALDPINPKTLYVVFADNRNGSSFPHPTRVAQEPQDSFFCPSGTTTDTDVFIAKSTDGGVTWGSPAGGSEPLRVNQDALKNGRDQWFPFVAIAPDGRVDVMFYDRRDDPFNRFAHVYLARSLDGGATWSEMRVSSSPSNMNWAFDGGLFMGDYNALDIGPDGTSYPFWTDARNGTPGLRQSDVFLDAVPP